MTNDISAASIGQQPGMSQQAIGNTGNTGMGSGMGSNGMGALGGGGQVGGQMSGQMSGQMAGPVGAQMRVKMRQVDYRTVLSKTIWLRMFSSVSIYLPLFANVFPFFSFLFFLLNHGF